MEELEDKIKEKTDISKSLERENTNLLVELEKSKNISKDTEKVIR